MVGVRVGTERIDDGAAREAELKVSDVIVRQAQGAEQTADNTWIVHIEGEAGVGDDDYSYPVSDNWVEPPLMSVGSGALEWDIAYTRFEQDGTDYLAFGKAIDDYESRGDSRRADVLRGQGLVAAARGSRSPRSARCSASA